MSEAVSLPETPVPAGDSPLPCTEFGEVFLRRVMHLERVLRSIDRILGDTFSLGPIKAGPGRRFASVTASGNFRPSFGEALPGDEVAYRVLLPVDVTFDLNVPLDTHHFQAQVLVPLLITMRVVQPLTILWDITPPQEDEVELTLTNGARRSAWLQKVTGLDAELRGFLLRFVDRELNKPHVLKARRIELIDVIDGAWEPIAEQFLPPLG